MNQFILLLAGFLALSLGSVLGYFARQSVAKKQAGTIEAKIQQKVSQAQTQAQGLVSDAKEKASRILEALKKEEDRRRTELLKVEQLLLKREHILDKKISGLDAKEKDIEQRIVKVREVKNQIDELNKKAVDQLEKVAQMTKEEAKKSLFENYEKSIEQEIMERIIKLEKEGIQRFEKKAKEILAFAIQKYALPQTQELTTTTIYLPSEEIKGRIIGKEGRNIRALERLTGVELVMDESPEVVVISAFDPLRRHIAKVALERLVQDGRIQPARIEEIVTKTEKEVQEQIREAGEAAVYDTGVIGLDPKLIQVLGRLKFRTSFGQNVLLHSIEMAHLAEAIASEVGANPIVAKKSALLHDIGKAIDRQVQGSHVEIGIKILEKFGVEKEVIDAMKSHHEEYPYTTIESVIVQAVDQISAARPGARRQTVENYIQRLEELERVALAFSGVEKAWVFQAGREIRVFVKPQEIDDLTCYKLAKDIAKRIEEELRYPGEIKVNVIREHRVVEYAK